MKWSDLPYVIEVCRGGDVSVVARIAGSLNAFECALAIAKTMRDKNIDCVVGLRNAKDHKKPDRGTTHMWIIKRDRIVHVSPDSADLIT